MDCTKGSLCGSAAASRRTSFERPFFWAQLASDKRVAPVACTFREQGGWKQTSDRPRLLLQGQVGVFQKDLVHFPVGHPVSRTDVLPGFPQSTQRTAAVQRDPDNGGYIPLFQAVTSGAVPSSTPRSPRRQTRTPQKCRHYNAQSSRGSMLTSTENSIALRKRGGTIRHFLNL